MWKIYNGDCMREVKIAENVRQIRKQKGYRSAAELCVGLELAGYDCSASLVKGWEAGVSAPSLLAISALCEVLDVTADQLIFGD